MTSPSVATIPEPPGLRFPPGDGFLLLPSSRDGFRSGLTLWPACRPLARVFRSVAHRTAGAWPGRTPNAVGSALPVDRDLWQLVLEQATRWFGSFDEMALYAPRQVERSGFGVLLIRAGEACGFVKAGSEDAAARAELTGALAGATTFDVPPLVGLGRFEGLSVVGYGAVGDPLHGPRIRTSLPPLFRELSDRLGTVLPRPASVPHHWEAMHGDLGPWNLRQVRGGPPVVFDLEHCGYGPPGADLVFHAAACRALRVRGSVRPHASSEAVAYWQAVIPGRFGPGEKDRVLAEAMLRVLSGW